MKLPEPAMRCVNGFSAMHYTIHCRKCGDTFAFPKPKHVRKSKENVVEHQLRRAMTSNGWVSTSGDKLWVCPTCTTRETKEKKMKVHAERPREATVSDRREINEILAGVYNSKRQMYEGNESDETVANTLNCPRKWVTDLRLLMFGEFDRNEKGETRNKDLDELDKRLLDERARIDGVIKKIDEILAALKSMRA